MPDTSEQDALRQQLSDLDAQITELQGGESALHAEAGGTADGAQDTEDVAAQLTNAQETEGILDALGKRRERLREQLGESG